MLSKFTRAAGAVTTSTWAATAGYPLAAGAASLPDGGTVTVRIGTDPAIPSFRIHATGTHIRVAEDVQRLLCGEATLMASSLN